MVRGTRRPSAPATTADPARPDSAALLSPPRGTSARRGRGGGRAGAATAADALLVHRSAVAPHLTCGICDGLLRDATAISYCLHAFCRQCIYDKLTNGSRKCPTCGILLSPAPLEHLRPDHSLQHIRSMVFHAKRRNVNDVSATNKKRKEKFSTESTSSSVVDIIIGGITTPREQNIEVEVISEADEASVVDVIIGGITTPREQNIEVEVISEADEASVVDTIIGRRTTPGEHNIEVEVISEPDEALLAQESVYESSILNLAPVGRDALSQIRCRDFHSACHLNAETGALIIWQPAPIPEEMVACDQLAPRQDPQTFGPPATSDTEYHRQAPAVKMTSTPVVAGSSFHARITVQDDDNLRGDILALFNESTAKIMGRYDIHIGELKAENSKLTEQLKNERATALERKRMIEERHQQELEKERAAAAERTRMLEERHQQELEKERAAAAERIRIIGERLQRESKITTSARNRIRSLEAQNARLNEGLENGRADNQALMSDIAQKSDELATLKYHCDMFESDKKDLQNQVENLKKVLEHTKREHARYAREVLDAASRVPMPLEGADPMYTTPVRAQALPQNFESEVTASTLTWLERPGE